LWIIYNNIFMEDCMQMNVTKMYNIKEPGDNNTTIKDNFSYT